MKTEQYITAILKHVHI